MLSDLYSHSWITAKLLAFKIQKNKVTMRKPVYVGLWILNLSKIEMHELWYDYTKENFGKKPK